jgi:hypothetical protein
MVFQVESMINLRRAPVVLNGWKWNHVALDEVPIPFQQSLEFIHCSGLLRSVPNQLL